MRSLKLIAAAALLLLTGCAAFSPDGGLVAVNDITRRRLPQDAVALRTPEDARSRARAASRRCCAGRSPPTAPCRSRCSTIAICRPPTTRSGLSEAAMVQASLPPNPTFSLERIAGARRARDREPHRRATSSRSRRCRRAPRSRPIASGRRSCRRRRRPCASPREARRAFYRAVAARALVGFLDAGARQRPRPRPSSPSASAKPAR